MGIVVTSTVLKINPTGIHQTMQNEHGYEIVIPDFETSKILKFGKKNVQFTSGSCKCQNLTSDEGNVSSRGDPNRSFCISVDASRREKHMENNSTVSFLL